MPKILIALIMSGCSFPAMAQVFFPEVSEIQLPSKMAMSSSTANGTVLWRSNKVESRLVDYFATPEQGISGVARPTGGGAILPGEIIPTTLRGVGVRFMLTYRGRINPQGNTVALSMQIARYGPAGIPKAEAHNQTVWIELVKTGPVSSGNLRVLHEAEVYFGKNTGYPWRVNVTGIAAATAGPSCSVTAPSIPVSLGKISVSQLNVKDASTRPVAFNLILSCSGGEPGAAIGSYVTLTDTSKPGNLSDILSLSPSSTAKGLGIQILHSGTPVKFGPDSAEAQNQNQWKAGDIRTGTTTFQIPLSARYIKTGAVITPGSANGQASFTMSYR